MRSQIGNIWHSEIILGENSKGHFSTYLIHISILIETEKRYNIDNDAADILF